MKPEDVGKHPPEDIVVLSTGSQGEQFAALSRISRKEHKHVRIEPGDTVLVSASPIPGNEKSVNRLINRLFACGADVTAAENKVHVSGHASQESRRSYLTLLDRVILCHGEYRMLVKHGELVCVLVLIQKHLHLR